MANEIVKQGSSLFEQIKQIDEFGNEFWYARQLAKILEYTDFRNFVGVINKAKEACSKSGFEVSEHLVEVNEVLEAGQGAKHSYPGFKLSRYFCYLIVQNADPSKEIVAIGQTYFAVQTRMQEIRQMDEYNALSSEEEKRLFDLLQDAYVQARYNLHFRVTKEDIEALIPKVELLRDITRQCCEERIKVYAAKQRQV